MTLLLPTLVPDRTLTPVDRRSCDHFLPQPTPAAQQVAIQHRRRDVALRGNIFNADRRVGEQCTRCSKRTAGQAVVKDNEYCWLATRLSGEQYDGAYARPSRVNAR